MQTKRLSSLEKISDHYSFREKYGSNKKHIGNVMIAYHDLLLKKEESKAFQLIAEGEMCPTSRETSVNYAASALRGIAMDQFKSIASLLQTAGMGALIRTQGKPRVMKKLRRIVYELGQGTAESVKTGFRLMYAQAQEIFDWIAMIISSEAGDSEDDDLVPIQGILDDTTQFLIDSAISIFRWVRNLFGSIPTQLANIFYELLRVITQPLISLFNSTIEFLSNVCSAFVANVASVRDGISKAIDRVKDSAIRTVYYYQCLIGRIRSFGLTLSGKRAERTLLLRKEIATNFKGWINSSAKDIDLEKGELQDALGPLYIGDEKAEKLLGFFRKKFVSSLISAMITLIPYLSLLILAVSNWWLGIIAIASGIMVFIVKKSMDLHADNYSVISTGRSEKDNRLIERAQVLKEMEGLSVQRKKQLEQTLKAFTASKDLLYSNTVAISRESTKTKESFVYMKKMASLSADAAVQYHKTGTVDADLIDRILYGRYGVSLKEYSIAENTTKWALAESMKDSHEELAGVIPPPLERADQRESNLIGNDIDSTDSELKKLIKLALSTKELKEVNIYTESDIDLQTISGLDKILSLAKKIRDKELDTIGKIFKESLKNSLTPTQAEVAEEDYSSTTQETLRYARLDWIIIDIENRIYERFISKDRKRKVTKALIFVALVAVAFYYLDPFNRSTALGKTIRVAMTNVTDKIRYFKKYMRMKYIEADENTVRTADDYISKKVTKTPTDQGDWLLSRAMDAFNRRNRNADGMHWVLPKSSQIAQGVVEAFDGDMNAIDNRISFIGGFDDPEIRIQQYLRLFNLMCKDYRLDRIKLPPEVTNRSKIVTVLKILSEKISTNGSIDRDVVQGIVDAIPRDQYIGDGRNIGVVAARARQFLTKAQQYYSTQIKSILITRTSQSVDTAKPFKKIMKELGSPTPYLEPALSPTSTKVRNVLGDAFTWIGSWFTRTGNTRVTKAFSFFLGFVSRNSAGFILSLGFVAAVCASWILSSLLSIYIIWGFEADSLGPEQNPFLTWKSFTDAYKIPYRLALITTAISASLVALELAAAANAVKVGVGFSGSVLGGLSLKYVANFFRAVEKANVGLAKTAISALKFTSGKLAKASFKALQAASKRTPRSILEVLLSDGPIPREFSNRESRDLQYSETQKAEGSVANLKRKRRKRKIK